VTTRLEARPARTGDGLRKLCRTKEEGSINKETMEKGERLGNVKNQRLGEREREREKKKSHHK
jgi:hypothetical protein